MSRKPPPPDDTPEASEEADEVAADATEGADPSVTAREAIGMPEEPGTDDDPGSYVGP